MLLINIFPHFQAAALLLFNASDKWSYADIKSELNLADDDLVRVLSSVSCAKYKILNKEPSSKTVSSTDQFEFNSQFTDKLRRIRVQILFRTSRYSTMLFSYKVALELYIRNMTCLYPPDPFASC